MEGFIAIFDRMDDPRAANARHSLFEVLFAALCCVVCGGTNCTDMEDFSEGNLGFLRRYSDYEHGGPSHDTFSRLFRLLDPVAFGEVFAEFMAAFAAGLKGVVAIDGKTVRRSFDGAGKRSALHMVNAWASDMKMVLGQVATREKSNEITAIPALLDLLSLRGRTVTIDAMGTQREIAAKIVDKKADYVLALKGNQPALFEDVRLFMDDPERAPGGPFHHTVDGDHGRIETRVATVSADVDWLVETHGWPGLKAVGRIVRTVETQEKTTTEAAYHLLSAPMSPERYAECVRAHWGVENSLHWLLDVTMREDEARNRKDHSAANLSILRRMAVNLLSNDPDKRPTKRKMNKARWNEDYRAGIVEGLQMR